MKVDSSQLVGGSLPVKEGKAKSAAAAAKEDAKLKSACTEMEAVFLNILWQQMRRSVPKNTLFGQSNQEEIMRSMLDSEMAKNMAKAGGVGLADTLYRQLTLTTNTPNKGQAPR
jgi:flagellar protein FlgJ